MAMGALDGHAEPVHEQHPVGQSDVTLQHGDHAAVPGQRGIVRARDAAAGIAVAGQRRRPAQGFLAGQARLLQPFQRPVAGTEQVIADRHLLQPHRPAGLLRLLHHF